MKKEEICRFDLQYLESEMRMKAKNEEKMEK
jgi:hypothetical protein